MKKKNMNSLHQYGQVILKSFSSNRRSLFSYLGFHSQGHCSICQILSLFDSSCPWSSFSHILKVSVTTLVFSLLLNSLSFELFSFVMVIMSLFLFKKNLLFKSFAFVKTLFSFCSILTVSRYFLAKIEKVFFLDFCNFARVWGFFETFSWIL